MKARYLIGPGILAAMSLCGAAGARSISVDSGQYQNFDSSAANNGGLLFSETSQTFSVDGLLLTFAPGTALANGAEFGPHDINPNPDPINNPNPTLTDYCSDSSACTTAITGGAMFNWGTSPASQTPGPSEQVIVYDLADGQTLPLVNSSQTFTTSGAFEVDFNYLASSATGCMSETASLNVGGQSYTSKTPCTNGDNAFFFNDSGGKLQLEGTPSGWSAAGATSVPEIDPNSAFAGLSFLFGGLAVLIGRRRLPRVAIPAA